MYFEDRAKVFGAFMGAVDVEQLQSILDGLQKSAAATGASEASKGAGKNRSMFMDIYAAAARSHMQRYGTTAEQFAMVSAKNSFHGSLNPRAQFREALTRRAGARLADDRRAADPADVLADRRRRSRRRHRQ